MAAKTNSGGEWAGLTPRQRRLAEALYSPEPEGSVEEICEREGISKNVLYRLQKSEGFKKYAEFLSEGYTDSRLAEVWRSLIKKCCAGDSQSIKLLLELKGKFRQSAETSGGVVFLGGEEDLSD